MGTGIETSQAGDCMRNISQTSQKRDTFNVWNVQLTKKKSKECILENTKLISLSETLESAGWGWGAPGWVFLGLTFPLYTASLNIIPTHLPEKKKKHPKGQIQHVLCKEPAGDLGGFWSLNKTEFLWCWSSGSLDSGATTRSCDTGSAHPETQMQHPDICFRALIGFSFPVSGAKLEILCLLHHHNSILDGFHSHLVIHWVSTRTVSLGSNHNPISLCSANAIIQKWIVLLRFQEFSPVCEPA